MSKWTVAKIYYEHNFIFHSKHKGKTINKTISITSPVNEKAFLPSERSNFSQKLKGGWPGMKICIRYMSPCKKVWFWEKDACINISMK